jgi:hypothetical protein
LDRPQTVPRITGLQGVRGGAHHRDRLPRVHAAILLEQVFDNQWKTL